MAWGDARKRRQERKEATRIARIDARAQRTAGRQAVTAEMAKQGMRRGQLVADVFGEGIGAARDVLSGSGQTEGKSKTKEGGDSNALPLIAGAGLLYYLMKKKK